MLAGGAVVLFVLVACGTDSDDDSAADPSGSITDTTVPTTPTTGGSTVTSHEPGPDSSSSSTSPSSSMAPVPDNRCAEDTVTVAYGAVELPAVGRSYDVPGETASLPCTDFEITGGGGAAEFDFANVGVCTLKQLDEDPARGATRPSDQVFLNVALGEASCHLASGEQQVISICGFLLTTGGDPVTTCDEAQLVSIDNVNEGATVRTPDGDIIDLFPTDNPWIFGGQEVCGPGCIDQVPTADTPTPSTSSTSTTTTTTALHTGPDPVTSDPGKIESD